MTITYLAHASFLLTSRARTKVWIDPYNETVGYEVPSMSADIVTTSHGHGDHNYTEAVVGEYMLIDAPGDYQAGEFLIRGIASFHDDDNGSQRGPNTMFVYQDDGRTIAHLGDLGHMLSAEQVGALGQVDVLILPVGGFYTIDAEVAAKVVQAIGPQVVIPMHYKTEKNPGSPISEIEPFLAAMEAAGYAIERPGTSELSLDELPQAKTVVQLVHSY